MISCEKEKTSAGSTITGTISLEVHAIHHAWDVSNIMIYLERNATEFPGRDSSVYDYKGRTDGYGKFAFEHLYPGNYYIYASGFDSIWGTNVIGEMPVVLDQSTLENNEAFVTLEVSE
jgi:hypothetical protein